MESKSSGGFMSGAIIFFNTILIDVFLIKLF